MCLTILQDKLKGQTGASASADGDVSLDAAMSADKQNRSVGGSASMSLSAGDANK